MQRFEICELLRGVAVEKGVVCGADVGAGDGGREVAEGLETECAVAEAVGGLWADAHGVAWRAVPAEDCEWGGAGE